jgi:hypothetical protein
VAFDTSLLVLRGAAGARARFDRAVDRDLIELVVGCALERDANLWLRVASAATRTRSLSRPPAGARTTALATKPRRGSVAAYSSVPPIEMIVAARRSAKAKSAAPAQARGLPHPGRETATSASTGRDAMTAQSRRYIVTTHAPPRPRLCCRATLAFGT